MALRTTHSRDDIPDDNKMVDAEVRDMLLRAGFDVNLQDDVLAFAKLMREMFADQERKLRSQTALRTFFIAVGSAIATAMIPIILHYVMKVN